MPENVEITFALAALFFVHFGLVGILFHLCAAKAYEVSTFVGNVSRVLKGKMTIAIQDRSPARTISARMVMAMPIRPAGVGVSA